MDTFLQIVANGLMLGGLFAIVAVGLTLIFGIVKVINFAHGEFLMVGMYLTFILKARNIFGGTNPPRRAFEGEPDAATSRFRDVRRGD